VAGWDDDILGGGIRADESDLRHGVFMSFYRVCGILIVGAVKLVFLMEDVAQRHCLY
jgi:hypothetical protein